jgi:hypothetical protein
MVAGFSTWVCFEFIVHSEVRSLVPATIVSVVSLVAISLIVPDKKTTQSAQGVS